MTQAEHTPNMRQQPNEVVENSIKLKREGATQVIDALNSDVASLFMLFHQYQKHHWVAEGPQFRDLHILLEEHYTATQLQADAFAERVVTLGGVPVSGPTAQLERGYVTEEPEGILDLRQMLSNDIKANQQILLKLREHIVLARQIGDYGSETLIKRHLREQELRTQDLMHMLEHETLDEILTGQNK
jgi:DNA-binding ferritin-like protein